MSIGIRRFMPHGPLELLRGPFGEWVVLILLCGLFIAIAGAILPKRLTEKRYGKGVTIFVGLILGIGLFMSKKLLNFNLESFGFLGIFIIIILMFLVTYGLLKMQFNKDMALGITYCMIFMTFYIMTPSLFDTIADSLPILNGIFFLTFFYILGKTIFNLFKGTGDGLKDRIKSAFINDNESQNKPNKALKLPGGTMELKDVKLGSLNKLKYRYDQFISSLMKLEGWMDKQQAKEATEALKEIASTKTGLVKDYKDLAENTVASKEIQDLRDRLRDFYNLLNEGMEHIKKAAIKPGLEILINAQKNLNDAVQVFEKIRNEDTIK